MGTRSRIGMKLSEGQILSIYCHWDGYPEFNGVILNEHFNTPKKISELLDGGNVSSLWTDSNWDNDKKKRDPQPLFYTDSGAKWDDECPLVSDDLDAYLLLCGENDTEFAYVFGTDCSGKTDWKCYNTRQWDDNYLQEVEIPVYSEVAA